ncbi:MAG: phosphoribosyltransferase family protein, partial [Pseudomonadota bacterium]|nr:phosphoribosyltransferase family protein [Pseudomonadota bacterium]
MAEGKEDRVFRDRDEAGRLLAQALTRFQGADVLVLALPRGGVPVAYHVARALDAPLDVFLARKLGAPMHPELGMGALTEGGLRVLDPAIVRLVGATPAQLERVIEREEAELRRRVARYRGGRPLPDVRGKVVVLVDDGIATGGTARAALRDLRRRGPARLVLATPVSAQDARHSLLAEADEVICLETPAWFHAIGEWYGDFHQLEDEDVIELLERARRERSVAATPSAVPVTRPMTFRVGDASLEADVTVPRDARGVVLFAHGSGSGRHSPRNRAVANALVDAGYGTVLLDLLTPAEEALDA